MVTLITSTQTYKNKSSTTAGTAAQQTRDINQCKNKRLQEKQSNSHYNSHRIICQMIQETSHNCHISLLHEHEKSRKVTKYFYCKFGLS